VKRPPRDGSKIEKKTNTLIIDGNSIFKTSFHGSKNEYNKDGEHVGGIYQFMVILRRALTDDLFHRVYVFWDGKFSGKLRYNLYEPYKSSRGKDFINGTKPIDESELRQRKIVWEYLNELYVRQISHEFIESDDFIGYYCLNKKENEKITILSNDRDMLQLISDDVRQYVFDLKAYVDKTNFNDYFKFNQENCLLIKMVLGDNSDTIKGIKGLGEETLFTYFPELKERKVSLNEFIELASIRQSERIANKLKPLKVLDNIINSVTDGVQGNKIYEINEKLINLKKPLLTEDGVEQINELIDGSLDSSGRELKNILVMMKRDGLDKIMGEYRFQDFLIPFKQLISRE